MKHIAFVMHKFAGGGAERITILLANELQKKGYSVTFLVKKTAGEFTESLNKNIKIIEICDDGSHFKQIASSIIKLRNELHSGKYDCVFSVSLGMSVFSIIANIANGFTRLYPVIHCAISQGYEPLNWLRLRIMRKLDKFAQKTVVVSEEARIDYLHCCNIPESKTITIYNPVISEELKEKMLAPVYHNWLEEHDVPILIAAGRLTVQKNYFLMLDALKIILKSKNVRLIILGQGELQGELIKYAEINEIENNVDFHGFESNPFSYFFNADCFLLTSDWEGLPTVLIEAMGCGCPIVSTDCISGPREILEDGKYGYLVPKNDKDAIAQAVLKTLEGKHVCKNDLMRKADEFNVNNSVEQYISLIENEL